MRPREVMSGRPPRSRVWRCEQWVASASRVRSEARSHARIRSVRRECPQRSASIPQAPSPAEQGAGLGLGRTRRSRSSFKVEWPWDPGKEALSTGVNPGKAGKLRSKWRS